VRAGTGAAGARRVGAGTARLGPFRLEQPQACGGVAQVLLGRATRRIRVARGNGLEDRLVFVLHGGHALGEMPRGVVARAAYHPPDVGLQVVVERNQVRVVRGQDDGPVELVVLFVAQLVVEQRVLHPHQPLADFLQVGFGPANRRIAGSGHLDGQHQFQDVLQVLRVVGSQRGNAESVLVQVGIDEYAAALLGHDQTLGLEPRHGFPYDGPADAVHLGQLFFGGQAVARGKHTLADLFGQRVGHLGRQRTAPCAGRIRFPC